MSANFIKCGESSPGVGGDFEREAMKRLREDLPSHCLIVGNASIFNNSNAYEYDIIITSPSQCFVLEVKRFIHRADVYEDRIDGIYNFSIGHIFVSVNNKAKILKGRITSNSYNKDARPFNYRNNLFIESAVILPDDVRIKYIHKDHEKYKRVMPLSEAINFLKDLFKRKPEDDNKEVRKVYESWRNYRDEWTNTETRTKFTLNRFQIKRLLSDRHGVYEYIASDQFPCKIDVHLKEYPYDPLLCESDLINYISNISSEMVALREIRHPNILCVIGHFQTGCSLVQVSDWFESLSLEERWSCIKEEDLFTKIGLMIKISEGLSFCHNKNIFHRNLSARNILVDNTLQELRIKGFEFAKNLDITKTISDETMKFRDRDILPPEELIATRNECNPRLGDIFQAGILFYRILENGKMPFSNVNDYYTGTPIDTMNQHSNEYGIDRLRDLITKMLSLKASDRPDPMSRIREELHHIS